MTGMIKISARRDTGYFRCGRFWPKAGVVINAADLRPDDLARLQSEPNLHVMHVDDGDADTSASDVRDQILAAIGALEATDFEASGKPRLSALRRLCPDLGKTLTSGLRDEIWASLQSISSDPVSDSAVTTPDPAVIA